MDLLGRHAHGDKAAHQCGVASLAVRVTRHRQGFARLGKVLGLDKVSDTDLKPAQFARYRGLLRGLGKGGVIAA